MNKKLLVASVGAWALFCGLTYLFIDPNISYLTILYSGFAGEHRIVSSLFFLLIISLQFLIYFYCLNKLTSLRYIKIIGGVCISLLLLAYPAMLSYDLFNYMTMAKLLFYYGENPYVVMPIEIIGEPYLLFTHFANTTTIYGPIWTLLSGIPHFLGFNTFIGGILGFKLLSACALVIISIIIWKLTNSIKNTVFFLLNPLVLIELVGSGHNDGVMMVFALLSFFFIQRKRYVLAFSCILLSIGIKFATIIIFPIILYAIIQELRGKKVGYTRLYGISFLCMFFVFSISFLRVEVYPWYAVWFLSFASLLPWNRLFHGTLISITIGLMLRYLPFMLTGTHFGLTPVLRMVLMCIPVIGWYLVEIVKHKLNRATVHKAWVNMLELRHK
ncbi:MAG TPA: hypothetical protein PLS49_00145 [Candidatus Woesebacteria bacterium]|nr:hypothetical protein [Candidatus Woesebacteria bacterium]